MSSTRHTFEIPASSKVTVPDLPGSTPKTLDAADHLRDVAEIAGASATFRAPDTWEVDVPADAELLFKLGAKELIDEFGKKNS